MKHSLKAASLLLFSSMLALPLSAKTEESNRPNIILIISDDQRWDTLGENKNPHLKTPNIDKLVKEGVYFPQATIHVSVCSPSRAALLTGLASHANGWYSNESQIPSVLKEDGFSQYDLLPDTLGKAGYHTAQIGKWHNNPRPWKSGFETVGTWLDAGMGKYKDAKLSHGKSNEKKATGEFTQTAFTDSAIEVIKNHETNETTRPLFLWFAFTASHTPYVPNPESVSGYYKKFERNSLRPKNFNTDMGTTEPLPATDWTKYYEAVSAMDEQVGRIVDTVKSSSLSTNTIILFQGDNGYMMGARQLIGKGVPYEESLRVPFFVWASDGLLGAAGKISSANVSSLDVPPTIAALAGVEAPKSWHGRDFSKILRDGNSHGIDWSISEYPVNDDIRYPDNGFRAVRTATSKLILWHPKAKKKDEFYDLAKDPHETKNLIESEEAQPEIERLRAIYGEWKTRTNDAWNVKGPIATRHKPDSPKAKRLAARKAQNQKNRLSEQD